MPEINLQAANATAKLSLFVMLSQIRQRKKEIRREIETLLAEEVRLEEQLGYLARLEHDLAATPPTEEPR